jgi:NAD-dependent deacetylase
VSPSTIFTIPTHIIKVLETARSIVVLTGAGISAESGIPTFRQAQTGLWAKYNPEELATPKAFQSNPKLVWQWYQWRRDRVSESEPNPGHKALVKLERNLTRSARDFILITQNVDGLHQRIGSLNVIELHGNIMRVKCFDCNVGMRGEISIFNEDLPRCKFCDGLLRPDVVWFGESIPKEAIEKAWKATNRCDVFLSIGTSGIVQPAASLPMVALQAGAAVIEVNPNPTPLTSLATFSIQGSAGTILPELIKLFG